MADGPGGDASTTAVDDEKDAGRKRINIPGWLEFPLLIIGAFLVAFLVKSFLVQAFYIPSGSMENTLQVGDRVLVNKVVYHLRPIERGDVIVFDGTGSFVPGDVIEPAVNPFQAIGRGIGEVIGIAPPKDTDFIKRVIGVGGDHVVCCDAAGRITVNGVALDEEGYLYGNNPPSKEPFDVVVPEGKLWVMGDHRSASADSRSHMGEPGGGFVPVDKVVGRAFAVVWPLSHMQVLEIPPTFEQPGLQASGAAVPATSAGAAGPGVGREGLVASTIPAQVSAWLAR